MIENDGDEVRGLGFVTLHSAYLEAKIHQLLLLLVPVEPYPEKDHTWQISRKIKEARKRLKQLDPENLEDARENLSICKTVFEWRNELVHSAIYASEYVPDNLVSTRPNIEARAVTPEEIYKCANQLSDLYSAVYRPMVSQIPTLLSAKL
jgi:hypothetical protein